MGMGRLVRSNCPGSREQAGALTFFLYHPSASRCERTSPTESDSERPHFLRERLFSEVVRSPGERRGVSPSVSGRWRRPRTGGLTPRRSPAPRVVVRSVLLRLALQLRRVQL